IRLARQAAAGLSASDRSQRRAAARTSSLVRPARASGVHAPAAAAARMPGRKPATTSSALVPVTTSASPRSAASGIRTSTSSVLQKAQRSPALATYPGRDSSSVRGSSWRTPRPAAKATAASRSAAGRLGETAVAATTRPAPRARTAAASSMPESTPPENATSTPGSGASRASGTASRSSRPESGEMAPGTCPRLPHARRSMTVLALFAAVAAMLSNTAASLLESAGTHRVTRERPVWRQPRYLIGLACDALGWVLSVVALRVLPVFAVQSVLAGTVAATPVAAAGGDPRRLSVRQRSAVVGVVLGLALVAASALPGRAERLPPAATPVLLVAAGALLAASVPIRRSGRPLLMTVVAGLAFGGVSLAVRAVHVRSSLWTSVLDLLAEPLAWVVLVFGATGTVLLAAALRRGVVGTVVAVLSVTEVIAPGLVGLVLLGDRVRPGWFAVLVTGWLLTVAGVVLLARSPAVSGAGSRP